MFIPPIGLILYIICGRSWKINKLNKIDYFKVNNLIRKYTSNNSFIKYKDLIQLNVKTSSSPLFTNNEIIILNGGKMKFEKLKECLLKATHHIHLEYYIVRDDSIGREIKDILIKKAKEGVKVRFIIDKIGSLKLNRKYIKDLKSNNIDVVFYDYIFAPILKIFSPEINYRNHRKIVVIDGSVGFLGGINIGDDYLDKGSLGCWQDCHIMIKGDSVMGLQSIFLDDYTNIKKCNKIILEEIIDNLNKYYVSPKNNFNSTYMQIIKSGPDSEYPSILQTMIKMISMAKSTIKITTPYFIPPEALMDSLRIASLSGINVELIFPEQADHFLVNKASLTYLVELARCGAKIYLYNNQKFIHSKMLIIDNEICTVGTTNLDIRSFELNYEVNAVIYDKNVTNDLVTIFNNDLKETTIFNLSNYENQNIIDRLINGISRLFSSIL